VSDLSGAEVDTNGNIALSFTTEGMDRGDVGPDGMITVKIHRRDE
jgi:hypothetical protein